MSNRFTIPLQSQVSAYILEKKKWPPEFCDYYANRFWNFYQSNGWKVSGKAAMKDWKAAFNAQWQTLKFKEDIDYLNRLQAIKQPETGDRNINFLNERLQQYHKHPTSVPNESLQGLYDYLKQERILKLTKEQIEIARDKGPEQGKGLAVKLFFENMIREGITFSQLCQKVKS